MSKKIKGNHRHLTLSQRTYIEQELFQKSSFRSIAAALHKDPSTISKEVLRSSKVTPSCRYAYRCRLMLTDAVSASAKKNALNGTSVAASSANIFAIIVLIKILPVSVPYLLLTAVAMP